MSGQLVGELLDARESGQLTGLTQGELVALVAIADRCATETRQGSVRWSRIETAMGKSRRTAQRAVYSLRDAGLVRIVRAGFKAHGSKHATATVYELGSFELASPTVAQADSAQTDTACATQGDATSGAACAKTGSRLRQKGEQVAPSHPSRPATQQHYDVATLDGSIYDAQAAARANIAELVDAEMPERPQAFRQDATRKALAAFDRDENLQDVVTAIGRLAARPDARSAGLFDPLYRDVQAERASRANGLHPQKIADTDDEKPVTDLPPTPRTESSVLGVFSGLFGSGSSAEPPHRTRITSERIVDADVIDVTPEDDPPPTFTHCRHCGDELTSTAQRARGHCMRLPCLAKEGNP